MHMLSRPAPAIHDSRCESAANLTCVCACSGMLHQRDLLVEAFDPKRSIHSFEVQLEKVFGSAFSAPNSNPTSKQSVRRSKFEQFGTATPEKATSQIEQRIVDVTLRDVLSRVRRLTQTDKQGWIPLLNRLTASDHWDSVAKALLALVPKHATQGYFWSSCLAAYAGRRAANRVSMSIDQYIASSTTVFDEKRYPRANSGRNIGAILGMREPAAIRIAIEQEIDPAVKSVGLPTQPTDLVLSIVGATVSPDLWRHPAAVRHLLLPAVKGLRRVHGCSFSLDSSTCEVENLIEDHLASEWRVRGVW